MADFETTKRVSRLDTESRALSRRYRSVRYDKLDGAWLYIGGFTIPPGWNRSTIEVLIDVPHGTPGYPSVAPEWFWTDHDLKTDNGRSISHFFTQGSGHTNPQYLDKGWGHFCIHIKSWQPASGLNLASGHSLITYLNLIGTVFNDRRRLGG